MKKSILPWAAGSILCGTLALSAIPATGRDKIEQVREVGKPVSCISITRIRSTDVVDDQTIDFEMAGGKTYRNTMPYSCPSLKFEDRFSYRLSGSQLCHVDTIRVLNNWGGGQLQEGTGCGLGKFQQVEKVKG